LIDAQDLVVNGYTVDAVSEFIYLSSKQFSRANSSADCVRRIALAAGLMSNECLKIRFKSVHFA